MKFHSVHGCNVSLDDNGSRASRVSSFCDGIAFSHKPVALNARVTVLLGANEDWTGALRLGVTVHDPTGLGGRKLPRYACPDLTARPGFWARPLPENWAGQGYRLTFYVNSKGQFHLFVNGEHKGAVLIGLPTKEQLWILLDLYGITISVKFVSNSGSAPSEVIARGPEAVQAYQNALCNGSASYYHARIALIGPPDGKKSVLKKFLIGSCDSNEEECEGIDTSCFCQTAESLCGDPWLLMKNQNPSDPQDAINGNLEGVEGDDSDVGDNQVDETAALTLSSHEEYFRAIAINIVREMVLQKKKIKEERKKTPLGKNAFRLQSSLAKIGSSNKVSSKQPDSSSNKENASTLVDSEDIPNDLPKRVVELVEAMLKESECKMFWERTENEKQHAENIIFNIWNYSGFSRYLFLHQLFLSSQTIYLFVFDLAQDLDIPLLSTENSIGLENVPSSDLTYISLLHMWLEMIYISYAYPREELSKNQNEENVINDIICELFPPVLVVGILGNSTTNKTEMEHQFNKIKESLQDKVYYHLVHPTFYCVTSSEEAPVDSMIQELRKKIEELALQLPHVGMEIPLKWMLFKQAVDRLIEREVYFADIGKLAEVARLEDIDSDDEFYSMVQFFHHQGKIWHIGSDALQGNEGYGTVILKPQWFIDYIYQLAKPGAADMLQESCDSPEMNVLEEGAASENFVKLWPNAFHHTAVLLSILDTVDVVCDIVPSEASVCGALPNSSTYLIPWLSRDENETENFDCDCLVLILDFSGLLPVGFFTKFAVRLFRWSKQHKWKNNVNQKSSVKGIPVANNHSMVLRKISGHKIKVTLIHERSSEMDDTVTLCSPSPHVCSKVRHLLEREADHLRDVWYKRLSYSVNVPCPCDKACDTHNTERCGEQECMHLLHLNECLSKKLLECDYRSVKTDFVQKFFHSSAVEGSPTNISMDCINTPLMGNIFWGEHDITKDEPLWVQLVAKMLTSANTGKDWISLAKRLGYNEREIRRFEDETLPAVSLLNNWIDSNGKTRYCIDLLIACLEQMGRQDIADLILIEIGPELPSPPVFISYQWESQESVLHLRRRIELAGYPCWMDVGHLGGGDTLYGKIYEGISRAKVVLCCLTPRYVLSPLCTREMSLADVLRKPIVPLMLEPTPWPPPGALALILSSLVYIDLCGIGGHGGSGRQADWEARFHSIIERMSHFISPSFSTHQLMALSGDHIIPPTTAVPLVRTHEEFTIQSQEDERDVLDNAAVPLSEADTLSIASSARDPGSSTPTVWGGTRRNRVVRCAICVLL